MARTIIKENKEVVKSGVFQFKTIKQDAPYTKVSDIDNFISENEMVVFTELVKCVEKMIETHTDKTTVFLRARFTNTDADLFIYDNEISTGNVNGKLKLAMETFIKLENYEMCERIKTIQNHLHGNEMQTE